MWWSMVVFGTACSHAPRHRTCSSVMELNSCRAHGSAQLTGMRWAVMKSRTDGYVTEELGRIRRRKTGTGTGTGTARNWLCDMQA
ncbi:hypothetical protein CABS01_06256 [Colletotrichum abscissum]|uniref:uncharacterized protein n=1 Tax=Colletotrichum abscissum TaxID=1671311 RepID=UPI0027D713FA|nr:uncharacterized protein CABS01_06256 [Colletotrichum abscissum]KAK1516289.1 hypothetical protein CABS01_06256 [Colletotrichum abscissum]